MIQEGFKDKLLGTQDIYDLMYWCYWVIGAKYLEVRKNIDYIEFEKLLPLKIIHSAHERELYRTQERHKFFQELKYEINRIEVSQALCLYMLKELDLEYNYHVIKSSGKTLTRNLVSLSNMADEDGIMLIGRSMNASMKTYFNNRLDSKRRADLRYNYKEINKELNKFIFIPKSEIQNNHIKFMHYYDSDYIKDMIRYKQKLNVAFVPVTYKNLEDILHIEFRKSAFIIKGMKTAYTKQFRRQYTNLLRQLIKDDIDIAVFPEMLLTEELLEILTDVIRKYNNGKIKLLLPGTIWKDRENICPVIAFNGDILFYQKKQIPFDYEDKKGDKYFEDLSLKDNTQHILDIDGLGRCFIHICKDMMPQNIANMRMKYGAEISFCSSFSRSLEVGHVAEIEAGSIGCTAFICNSCAAKIEGKKDELTKGHNIGAIYLPAKKGSSNTSDTLCYKVDNDCNNCAESICYHKYTIYINELSVIDGKSRLKVEKNHIVI